MSHLQLIKKIKYFEKFKEGWDGEAAKPPSEKAILTAKYIANSLPQDENWTVNLTIDGIIIFEGIGIIVEVI